MKVADSYAKAKILSTFEKGNKLYAHISHTCDRCGGTGIFYVAVHNGHGVPATPHNGMCYKCDGEKVLYKDVRLYTDEEYNKLQKQAAANAAKRQRDWDSQEAQRREAANVRTLTRFGFIGPKAYAVLGNTYDIIDELKQHNARFTSELRWVCPEEPTWLTAHIYAEISVEQIFTMTDGGYITIREDAAALIQSLEPMQGRYLGNVGLKLYATATLAKCIEGSVTFGYHSSTTYLYIFNTAQGDTITWSTSTVLLTVGKTYAIEGTVKEHKDYYRIRQTVLTRCKVKEVQQ